MSNFVKLYRKSNVKMFIKRASNSKTENKILIDGYLKNQTSIGEKSMNYHISEKENSIIFQQ
jgi:hypothetical protein